MVVYSYYESRGYDEKLLDINFSALANLQEVYDCIIEQLAPREDAIHYNIKELRELHETMNYLRREIKQLEEDIKKEARINKKVGISLQLDKKKDKFGRLLGSK